MAHAVGFTRADRLLHWMMAALFAWQFALRWIAGALPEGHPSIEHLVGTHSLGGFAILALAPLRLGRGLFVRRTPILPVAMSG